MSFLDLIPRLDGLEALPMVLATGSAGDLYLCHPFLVHAATWPHRGREPRFIAQPGLAPTEAWYSSEGPQPPVKRAIEGALREHHQARRGYIH